MATISHKIAITAPFATMSSKHVSFATIEIFEFPITLGDSPSVSDGPPLTIGWKPQKITALDLDYFEKFRPQRRHRRDLILDTSTREDLLLRSGVTFDEILYWQEENSADQGIIHFPTKSPSSVKSSSRLFMKRIRKLSHKQHELTEKLQKLNQMLTCANQECSSTISGTRNTSVIQF